MPWQREVEERRGKKKDIHSTPLTGRIVWKELYGIPWLIMPNVNLLKENFSFWFWKMLWGHQLQQAQHEVWSDCRKAADRGLVCLPAAAGLFYTGTGMLVQITWQAASLFPVFSMLKAFHLREQLFFPNKRLSGWCVKWHLAYLHRLPINSWCGKLITGTLITCRMLINNMQKLWCSHHSVSLRSAPTCYPALPWALQHREPSATRSRCWETVPCELHGSVF